jgi:two-component system, OmpR family, response regulator
VARVLVVEDDDDVRDLIATQLLIAGHQVVATPDARSALANQHCLGEPQAYVLDVRLPDVDGFDLLGRLRDRAEGQGVPAIFLTADATGCSRRSGESLGAGYLTKPFRADRLVEMLHRALATAAGR